VLPLEMDRLHFTWYSLSRVCSHQLKMHLSLLRQDWSALINMPTVVSLGSIIGWICTYMYSCVGCHTHILFHVGSY
jgi:hypothetical protein